MADEISDTELTALALAADPDTVVAADAVNLWDLAPEGDAMLLPSWYQPAPMRRRRMLSGWRRRVVLVIIVSFLLIDAAGLCSTYGHVVLA